MTRRNELVDQADRLAAIHERERNVVVDAGAGSGKTSLVVRRLLRLVAPDDAAPPISLSRIAAITFTRRAAGELRFRIREALLTELTGGAASPARRHLLHDALSELDTAYVTTIHGFADRLLRLVPRKAGISPGYAIAEDPDALANETHHRLLRAAQDGTLGALTGGRVSADRLEEARAALRLALEAGIPSESTELSFSTRFGLDALVRDLVLQRDVALAEPAPVELDRARFLDALAALQQAADAMKLDSVGAARVRTVARELEPLRNEPDPARIHRRATELVDRFLVRPSMLKSVELGGHAADWARFTALTRGTKDAPPIIDELLAPTRRWLASRLVRLRPAVIAAYDSVKRERGVLDHVDLLLRLRDLLATDRDVRRQLGELFDHLFVDEFQDTDPLQAELIVWLCDAHHRAADWRQVTLAPGRLTVVGDPKQSIYRFRRADVALYDEVRSLLLAQGALSVELRTGFRSVPSLVSFANHAFPAVLGLAKDERPFDPQTGRVFHRALSPTRAELGAPSVQLVPFESVHDRADAHRALEATAMARYLRWLVRASGFQVHDPHSGERRPVHYDDIAVLAFSTTQLPLLFAELDASAVPYSARGGTLFLSSDLSRRFLLALRAIADPEDGVAHAALMRSPFFALSLADLAAEDGEAKGRVTRARALVDELRHGRSSRPIGATARALIERTALGPSLASMPNGASRLAHLRELCLVVHALATQNGWDYDAVTAHVRAWIDSPIHLDPPRPIETDAVEVLTVHQAKGLEWPVVVIWDGRAPARSTADAMALRVDRDGAAWALGLESLSWEEPEGAGLADTERAYRDAERARLLYVAATRARDRLVLPVAGAPGPAHLLTPLIDAAHPAVETLARFGDETASDDEAWWRVERTAHGGPGPIDVDPAALSRAFTEAFDRAASASFRSRAVTAMARGEDASHGPPRHGPELGLVVHAALEAFVRAHARGAVPDVRAIVSTAIAAHALPAPLQPHVAPDVERAVTRMRAEGWLEPGVQLFPELPVAGEGATGELLNGTIDLLVVRAEQWTVVDYKTDTPPSDPAAPLAPAYVAQLRAYAHLLRALPLFDATRLRLALLFTADGTIRVIDD